MLSSSHLETPGLAVVVSLVLETIWIRTPAYHDLQPQRIVSRVKPPGRLEWSLRSETFGKKR